MTVRSAHFTMATPFDVSQGEGSGLFETRAFEREPRLMRGIPIAARIASIATTMTTSSKLNPNLLQIAVRFIIVLTLNCNTKKSCLLR